MMNTELAAAYELLEIDASDDSRQARQKYRKLIAKYHPDIAGGESAYHNQKAQELNLAWNLVKKDILRRKRTDETAERMYSHLKKNDAFTERNIYAAYYMDFSHSSKELYRDEALYRKFARGKYDWDPDEEEFDLFLKSILHEVNTLLEQVEEQVSFVPDRLLRELRFDFQVKLYHLLASQFVDPLECLHKLAEPIRTDAEGTEIYLFRAYLGNVEEYHLNIRKLKKNDPVYPMAFQQNRIAVKDRNDKPLGYISFAEDEMYFCLLPLLKAHYADVKMHVEAVETGRRMKSRVRADISMFVRVKTKLIPKKRTFAGTNSAIRKLLREYGERCTYMQE